MTYPKSKKQDYGRTRTQSDMEVSEKLNKFLSREDILSKLEYGNFSAVYREFSIGSVPLDVRELSTVLILAQLHPLDHMSKVPDHFLYGKLQPHLKDYLRNLYIPDNIQIIGAQAFKNCRFLKTIHLPKSISLLEDDCLAGIDLEMIYYDGTLSDWEKIVKGEGWYKPYKLQRVVMKDCTLYVNDEGVLEIAE